MENVTIDHRPDRARYEISVAGEAVGLSRYRDSNGQRVFLHTEVDSSYQGHGLATKLIAWALDDTRKSGLRIVASCPMVAAFVEKHDEYDDIVDRDSTPPA
jgi:uncharacterized protein